MSAPDAPRRRVLDGLALLVTSVAMGWIATSVDYVYGEGNHVSELPITLAWRNGPDWLANDPYVAAVRQFGPRTLFAWTCLAAERLSGLTLPQVYLALTVLSNSAIAGVTFATGRRWFGDARAGALAAGLVMTAETYHLGYQATVPTAQLLPSLAAMPFALAALGLGLAAPTTDPDPGRLPAFPLAVALACVGALLHPTLGLEAGGLVVGAGGIAVLRGRLEPRAWAGGAALLAAVAAGWTIALGRGELTGPEFVAIESWFRHPHHVSPRTFPAGEWRLAALFTIGTAAAWWAWWRDERPESAIRVGWVLVALGSLQVAGWLFVDVVPVKLVAMARTYRLLIFAKWLGLVLAAGVAARAGRSAGATVGIASLWPWAYALVAPAHALARRHRTAHTFAMGLAWATTLGIAGSWWAWDVPLALAPLAAVGPIVAAWWAPRSPAVVATIVAPLALAGWWATDHGPRHVDGPGPTELERWVQRHTPDDAVFLTPPIFSAFRLGAQRAMVVDFQSFPFREDAMAAWFDAMEDVYGPVPKKRGGFDAARRLTKRYHRLDDQTLLAIGARHGATHAVRARGTTTSLPVLHASGRYEVVALAPAP